MIINNAPGYPLPPAACAAFERANNEYYEHIDWALDISKARFIDTEIRLPPRLIRRDPETQIVVPRARLLDGRWRELALRDRPAIELALRSIAAGTPHVPEVLIANAKTETGFKKDIAMFELLRREGIAEPN